MAPNGIARRTRGHGRSRGRGRGRSRGRGVKRERTDDASETRIAVRRTRNNSNSSRSSSSSSARSSDSIQSSQQTEDGVGINDRDAPEGICPINTNNRNERTENDYDDSDNDDEGKIVADISRLVAGLQRTCDKYSAQLPTESTAAKELTTLLADARAAVGIEPNPISLSSTPSKTSLSKIGTQQHPFASDIFPLLVELELLRERIKSERTQIYDLQLQATLLATIPQDVLRGIVMQLLSSAQDTESDNLTMFGKYIDAISDSKKPKLEPTQQRQRTIKTLRTILRTLDTPVSSEEIAALQSVLNAEFNFTKIFQDEQISTLEKAMRHAGNRSTELYSSHTSNIVNTILEDISPLKDEIHLVNGNQDHTAVEESSLHSVMENPFIVPRKSTAASSSSLLQDFIKEVRDGSSTTQERDTKKQNSWQRDQFILQQNLQRRVNMAIDALNFLPT